MTLGSLKLTNFRNYPSFEIDFSPLTIFTGTNGIGKTNLIEAIFFCTTAKSYRAKTDQDIIEWGKDFSEIICRTNKNKISIFISRAEAYGGLSYKKIIKSDGVIKKISEFLSDFNLNTVLFSPESMQIITGSPNERRRFLNLILSQVDKHYFKAIIDLQKILKNRNSLLLGIKIGKNKKEELLFWNQELVKVAEPIIAKRKKFIGFINQKISQYHQKISAEETKPIIKYLSNIEDAGYYLDLLAKNEEREIHYASTLFGPHRDDFQIIVDGKNIMSFASRGEIRSIIFALKMLELDYLKENKKDPILLLDDIFSELDQKRKKALLEIVKQEQTIITCTDIDFISGDLKKKAKIVNLGQLE